MGENQPRGDDGSFGAYRDEPWLTAVESVGSGSTREIHDYVCENWENGDGPAYKTTYDKLHKLADEDQINKKSVGGNWEWSVRGGSRKEHVVRVVEEKGPARAEILAEFSDIPEKEFEELLRELEDEGRVVSELTGSNVIWQPP